MERLKRRKANPGLTGLTTGFKSLDSLTMGLKRDELIILGARPSMGKSAAGLQIASHVAKTHGPVMFISLEMSEEQLSDRLMSNFSHVTP